jgi:hypothetical protein
LIRQLPNTRLSLLLFVDREKLCHYRVKSKEK